MHLTSKDRVLVHSAFIQVSIDLLKKDVVKTHYSNMFKSLYHATATVRFPIALLCAPHRFQTKTFIHCKIASGILIYRVSIYHNQTLIYITQLYIHINENMIHVNIILLRERKNYINLHLFAPPTSHTTYVYICNECTVTYNWTQQ